MPCLKPRTHVGKYPDASHGDDSNVDVYHITVHRKLSFLFARNTFKLG